MLVLAIFIVLDVMSIRGLLDIDYCLVRFPLVHVVVEVGKRLVQVRFAP